MPVLHSPIIRRAWRHTGEPDRIHYVANGGSVNRRLYVDKGNALYPILDEALKAMGYEGPKIKLDTPRKALATAASPH